MKHDTFLYAGILKNTGDGTEFLTATWTEVQSSLSQLLKNTMTQKARSGSGTTGCPNAKRPR